MQTIDMQKLIKSLKIILSVGVNPVNFIKSYIIHKTKTAV